METDTYHKFDTKADQVQRRRDVRSVQEALYQQISQIYSRHMAALWRRSDNLDGLANLVNSFLAMRLADLNSTDRAQVLALDTMEYLIILLRKSLVGVLSLLVASYCVPVALAADPSAKHEQEGLKEFLGRPTAPKAVLQSKSLQGPMDPYPAADALARHNVSRWADLDWKGMRTHDNSSAGYLGDPVINGPLEGKAQQIIAKSLVNCRALSQSDMPQGFTLSEDLHDFVLNPAALQASLASQGMLFAPMSTEHWRILQFSWQLAGHDMPHWDGSSKTEYTNLQTFWRMVSFVAVGSISQLHKALVQAAAAQGYVFNPPPKVPGWKAGDEFMSFTQRVTPVVANNAVIAISDPSTDDGDPESAEDKKLMQQLHKTGWRCFVFNDQAKDWLKKINPKTNLPYQLSDLKLGYILQSSIIPLGAKTEEFTKAHLKERLDKERQMTPAQWEAYRKAEEKRLELDMVKNAPTFQDIMKNKAAKGLDESAEVSKDQQKNLYPQIFADMRKEGVPEAQIQQLKALVDKNTQEAYKIGKQGAKELREYIHQANTQ